MASQCQGTNRNGEPCSAHVYGGDVWCRWHDPAREADRAEWSRKGGQARSNRARAKKQLADQVMTISDMDALLCSALTKVSEGTMEPGVGVAMGSIAKTIAAIRTTGDFEKRLEELERSVGVGTIRRIGS